jgi:hypothetical protein
MYLPFHTTSAIFIGGIIKWIVDMVRNRQKLSRERAENTGILLASGLIAGQALMGIIIAATVVAKNPPGTTEVTGLFPKIIAGGNPWLALAVFAIVAYVLIRIPLRNARVGNA